MSHTRCRIRSWKSWGRLPRSRWGRPGVSGGFIGRSIMPENGDGRRRAAPVRESGLDDALVQHRVGDLEEAGDVGAVDVVTRRAETIRRLDARLVDALHDELEAAVHLLAGPAVAHAVLRHLEARGGDAAGV